MSTTACATETPAVGVHRHDELANCITHGLGCALSIAGTIALFAAASELDDRWRLVGCGIYAATLVAVYGASTLSHVFQERRLRHLFRTLDQAFIYLLIVGTYTPLALGYLHGGWLNVLLGAMWLVALAGFLSKLFWRHRIDAVSLTAYIVLGWMPIFSLKAAWDLMPLPACLLMVAGGLCYTFGTLFLMRDHRRFFHAIWHLFVMAGSVCHFVAIFLYVAR
jgi:hemolysin III